MASSFKDGLGREFTLLLNYTKARQIRESLALDFVDLAGICETFAKLDLDTDLLMKVLYALVKPQCEAKQIDENSFGDGFTDGDHFQAAREALSECAINFSNPRTRDELRKALEIQTNQLKEMLGSKIAKMQALTGG